MQDHTTQYQADKRSTEAQERAPYQGLTKVQVIDLLIEAYKELKQRPKRQAYANSIEEHMTQEARSIDQIEE